MISFLIFTCAKVDRNLWRTENTAKMYLEILTHTLKLADWEEDISEIYSPGEMQVMLPLDYPNTNPTMNPSISYLLPSISANINYSNCEYCQSNNGSLSRNRKPEVFGFSNFLHSELHSLMTCSHSPPWLQAPPLLSTLVKHSCSAPSGWLVDRTVSLESELTEGFWYQVKALSLNSVLNGVLVSWGPQKWETSILTPDHWSQN